MAREMGLRIHATVFVMLLLPVTAAAQDEFADVNGLWSTAEYGKAIDKILTPCIARLESLMVHRDLTQEELLTFQQASLLLVLTRALYYDHFNLQEEIGLADLQIDAARDDIDKLLSVKALRHTHPDSSHALVLTLFEEIRKKKFGSLAVQRLDPPNATVILENDTLRVAAGEQYPSALDLLPGTYRVLVRCDGHRDLRESVFVKKGDTTAVSYELEPGRNWWWWTWRGTVVAGAATAITLGLTGDDEATPVTPDLPGPPDPPSR